MTHKIVIVHVILTAGSDPTSLCFLFVFGLVVVLCVLFAWLLLFWFVICSLMGPLTGTVYRSITSTFVAINK